MCCVQFLVPSLNPCMCCLLCLLHFVWTSHTPDLPPSALIHVRERKRKQDLTWHSRWSHRHKTRTVLPSFVGVGGTGGFNSIQLCLANMHTPRAIIKSLRRMHVWNPWTWPWNICTPKHPVSPSSHGVGQAAAPDGCCFNSCDTVCKSVVHGVYSLFACLHISCLDCISVWTSWRSSNQDSCWGLMSSKTRFKFGTGPLYHWHPKNLLMRPGKRWDLAMQIPVSCFFFPNHHLCPRKVRDYTAVDIPAFSIRKTSCFDSSLHVLMWVISHFKYYHSLSYILATHWPPCITQPHICFQSVRLNVKCLLHALCSVTACQKCNYRRRDIRLKTLSLSLLTQYLASLFIIM